MGIQNALLSAAGAVANAGLAGKKVMEQKKPEVKKTTSPSALAAEKAKASLSEQREAKKIRGSFQTYEAYKNIRNAPLKM